MRAEEHENGFAILLFSAKLMPLKDKKMEDNLFEKKLNTLSNVLFSKAKKNLFHVFVFLDDNNIITT